MFSFRFLSFFTIILAQDEHRMYRRLVLDEGDWTKFVFKTISFDVKTKIECGSTCNYHKDQCSLFSYDEFLSKCHIGNFEHQNSNTLLGMPGQSPVYLFLGKYHSRDSRRDIVICNLFLIFRKNETRSGNNLFRIEFHS